MDAIVHKLDAARQPAASSKLAMLAPRPRSLDETGLDRTLVAELIEKHLFDGGVLAIGALSRRLALSGQIVEDILHFLRKEARIEILAGENNAALRYALTDRGRVSALTALARSGYIGPAPVTLEAYSRIARAQTVHQRAVTHDAMHRAFSDTILRETLLDQLGPAMNSGRAIFVYGAAGTGKTFITQRLARLLSDTVLIPHAVAVNETIFAIFDPVLHKRANEPDEDPNILLDQGHDPRFVESRRPVVISGGELSGDMLEMHYDSDTRDYRAPLQLKANNGLFIIDDMGRQRISPAELLNRWIVPMEEARDYLSLGSGRHFSVPFDVVLVFSTNMNPLELADEAFLRRIGYKIRFDYLTPGDYGAIWDQVCEERGVEFDPEILRFVLEELHARESVPLLPCHPRDLLGIALDDARYCGEPHSITPERLERAWRSYFVSLDSGSSVDSSYGAPAVKFEEDKTDVET
jgi:hypothetical protein